MLTPDRDIFRHPGLSQKYKKLLSIYLIYILYYRAGSLPSLTRGIGRSTQEQQQKENTTTSQNLKTGQYVLTLNSKLTKDVDRWEYWHVLQE